MRSLYRQTTILYSQVVLSLEGLGAEAADILPLIAVRELVFGECARVVKRLSADGALGAIGSRGHLTRTALRTGFG